MIIRKRIQAKTLLLMLSMTMGCASNGNIGASPDDVLFKSMKVVIDDTGIEGVGVLPSSPAVRLFIDTPAKPEFVKITTCHREDIIREPGKRLEYVYRRSELEQGYCLMEIAAFDDDGEHDWALIDWRGDEKLEAKMDCSGKQTTEKGVSLCQSRAGLIQKLEFKKYASVANDQDMCPIEKIENAFVYVAQKGKCLFVFSDGQNIHRHTSYGYTEVRIK